ncbi:MAG: histidinol phosphatase [Planctomycetes bacterium]|nr:histidinol phosphatase [Planctomycetota bacterium]
MQRNRQPVRLKSSLKDYRCVIHVHSFLSHDSRGTVDEIVQAARAAGVRVVMFTEHPDSETDFFVDGHRGWRNGVLLIPGAETSGLLIFPKASVRRSLSAGPQKLADAVRATGGLTFLSHVEKRMDWELKGLTGTEIYNTHADFKDEVGLIKALTNPLTLLLQIAPVAERYPQGVFAALQDYPADYLRKWDKLCAKSPHTGIAANDAHHNQGLRATYLGDGRVRLADALGESIGELDVAKIPLLAPLVRGKPPGDVVMAIDLDPYLYSFRHVSTHLLMPELSEAAVREALRKGRAYVAFDWMADPTGFLFQARGRGRTWPMGSEVRGIDGLILQAAAPLAGQFRFLCNGQEISRQTGRSAKLLVPKPGVYRVEVWLQLGSQRRIWILSNPIYCRAG